MLKKLIGLVTLTCLALTSACGTTYTYRVSDVRQVAVKDPHCQQRRLTEEHCEERDESDSGDAVTGGVVAGLVILGVLGVIAVAGAGSPEWKPVSSSD